MSGNKMRFRVSPKTLANSGLTAGPRNDSGSEFQTVGPATEKARRCQMRCDETAEYSVCDGWQNGNVGGR